MSATTPISVAPSIPPWATDPEQTPIAGQPEAWADLRSKGFAAFRRTGIPVRKMEAWRNSSVAHLLDRDYQPALSDENISRAQLEPYIKQGAPSAVLVNGIFSHELSTVDDLPAGLALGSLADELRAGNESLMAHLDGDEALEEHPFSALNLAMFSDGIWLEVQAGTQVETVVQLLIISTGEQPVVSFPRVLIAAGENSQVAVLERYINLGGEAHLSLPVTDIICQQAAAVEHLKLHAASGKGEHIGRVRALQHMGSRLHAADISTGDRLIRNEVQSRLTGEGAEAMLSGLYLVSGSGRVDNQTRIDHIAPRTTSLQTYKGILADSARGAFTGRVVVHPDAQKTEARQTNRNLMLSDKARVHTDPQLEIFADDVKCTHGSTVGQIDADALFYFRTRGIDEATARKLLISGFTQDVVATLANAALRDYARSAVDSWLESAGLS